MLTGNSAQNVLYTSSHSGTAGNSAVKPIGYLDRARGLVGALSALEHEVNSFAARLSGTDRNTPAQADPMPAGLSEQIECAENTLRRIRNTIENLNSAF